MQAALTLSFASFKSRREIKIVRKHATTQEKRTTNNAHINSIKKKKKKLNKFVKMIKQQMNYNKNIIVDLKQQWRDYTNTSA